MTHTAKHTPGPWVPYNSDKGRIFSHWYIRVDSGPTIVTVHNGLPDNQDMGNAALIAAAPAMYEALKALHSVLDQRMPDGRTLNQHLSQEVFECFYGPAIAARAAIAKAEVA